MQGKEKGGMGEFRRVTVVRQIEFFREGHFKRNMYFLFSFISVRGMIAQKFIAQRERR
jgi:hypothetical protein